MPKKIYSSEDLNEAFKIYNTLNEYKKDASAFLRDNAKGFNPSNNYTKKRIKDLIAQVEKIDGLKNEPIFEKIILDVTKSYELKKLMQSI